MRTTFINKVTEMARKDKDIYLITGDLGFSVFENFEKEFSDRFINVGIAESAMIGIAAGLALNGKKIYVYSIAPFLTMRCFEQIRVDLCYQNLNVNLIGVGGGLSYGASGATHHAIEDIAIMRSLPNMKVICPGDPFETENIVEQVLNIGGPTYIRLNKNREPRLYTKKNINFQIGKAIRVFEGNDVSIIATGNMLEQSINISKRLKEIGYSVNLISMHTIKPIDINIINECISNTKYIFTMEEHNVIGGLASAVSEVVVSSRLEHVTFKAFGIPDVYADCAGSRDYFRKKYNIDEDNIFNEMTKILNENGFESYN
ncbi:transketolase C-terminal domain-containing protein [Clostridium sp. A1-XYC3]|uniref:Transketolase C-terminal domain-containing protein n=1 Tax=Clostridium tanneri TaxID=3037988 RepID=A0ABU4JNL2_9CLOT|nr:transketolase C-terminal domain-containing protein [Clostridium sp. A1-XYC3]MDW8799687.1 transketolase C-terminal domain-containing protein [Clostridium sp. A1-XYC3]